MQTITFRLDQQLSKLLDKHIQPYYSTKTEFIREAIRDKLKQIEIEEFHKKYYKSMKGKPLTREDKIQAANTALAYKGNIFKDLGLK